MLVLKQFIAHFAAFVFEQIVLVLGESFAVRTGHAAAVGGRVHSGLIALVIEQRKIFADLTA